eukprot:CAMPEP_0202094298 /NCGR_PEP_ID=MMETSP0964-20121228/48973_1 /ASSEMBLY_ACC=CAM_ASM_000500 /TAXON_ID=4773 /ORGANISM="Schizochytrium aggregatum, Strain ATCC28209" /LENGTH=461 /DNA_ID=CAMNT_0048662553 /DNA_START=84 /DNA_END=1470 /DNA_ORIENTATION=+
MGRGEDGARSLLSRTTLAHAVAGSVGSVIAMAVTYPLDRVRTIKQLARERDDRSPLQVLRTTLREEGWAGVYGGLQPMLVALGASNFVYFYFFTALKTALQYLLRRTRPRGALAASDGGALVNLLLASVAGTLNVLITTPLWVAYTRIAVQNMEDLRRAKRRARDRRPVEAGNPQQHEAAIPLSPSASSCSDLDRPACGENDLDEADEACPPTQQQQQQQQQQPRETKARGAAHKPTQQQQQQQQQQPRETKARGAAHKPSDAPERYAGVLDAMVKIGRRDGLAGLWSGVGPSLILVSNPSVQFASYEWLKRALLRFKLKIEPGVKDFTHFDDILDDHTDHVVSEAVTGPQLNSLEYLFLGAFAKMIATVVTYPLQVAQTRLRAQNTSAPKEDGPEPYRGTLDCLVGIYRDEGLAGLYRGMEAKLWQTCLTSAFMFAAYERICAIILRTILWRKFSKRAVA